MANGTVKWFNHTKGFGFIKPDQGSSDMFVHISELEKAGIRMLGENDRLSYETARQNGKEAAVSLKLLSA